MKKPSLLRLLIYVLAVLMVVECSGQATETPADFPFVRVLSARARLEEAWRLARQWRDDAELKQIQASIIGPEQVSLLDVNFDFESPSEDRLVFAAMCFPGSCYGREFEVPVTSGWGAIEFDEDMIDSIEAATIGLQNGGERFAYAKGVVAMSVSLVRDNPRYVGPTIWLAYFAIGYEEPLYVVIDPYTGDVIRTE